MKRLLLPFVCVLPWLAGCAVFTSEPAVPPAPEVVGVTAQNMALQHKVRQGRGDQTDVFVPLLKAKAAVEAARAQPQVNTYAAGLLAQARAELDKAQKLWQAAAANHEVTQLRKVQTHAHSAQRLAQIARYTALREINLAQLSEAGARLRQQQGGNGAATATVGGQQLIGKKVVPGSLGQFSFRAHTARLSPQSQAVVARLASLLQRNPDVGVAILGHTSNSEPSSRALKGFVQANPQLKQRDLSHQQKVYAYNLALSNARARAVARALVQAGIEAQRIGARGFGSSRPVASNDTAAGRNANERIVAVIIPGPGSNNSPLKPAQ